MKYNILSKLSTGLLASPDNGDNLPGYLVNNVWQTALSTERGVVENPHLRTQLQVQKVSPTAILQNCLLHQGVIHTKRKIIGNSPLL